MSTNSIKKILVPIDGSDYSKRAATKAITIAKKFDSEIIFVTAVSRDLIQPPSKIFRIFADDKQLQESFHSLVCRIPIEIKKILKGQVEKCRRAGVFASYEIIEGEPIKTVLAFSNKFRPDLIVIGSQGLSGLSKIKALGSTSRNILESTRCPVLIVK